MTFPISSDHCHVYTDKWPRHYTASFDVSHLMTVLDLGVYICPSQQGHLPSNLRDEVQVNISCRNLWLFILVPQLRYHLAPRINDHRMSVTSPFFVVGTCLRSGYDIGLIFDSPCTKQRLPMSFACWDCKRRRVCNNLSILAPQCQADFWKA